MKDIESTTNGRTKFTTKTKSVTTLMRNIEDFAKDVMDKETDDAEKIVGMTFADAIFINPVECLETIDRAASAS